MTSLSPGQTARIYQFPLGGRAGLAARETPKPATEAGPQRMSVDITGWYHEAAIEEAKRGLDH